MCGVTLQKGPFPTVMTSVGPASATKNLHRHVVSWNTIYVVKNKKGYKKDGQKVEYCLKICAVLSSLSNGRRCLFVQVYMPDVCSMTLEQSQ